MSQVQWGEEMSEIRKQFEGRSDIKVRLDLCLYDENLGVYRSKSSNEYATAAYLNGAWYAFQEQQKKIDMAMNRLNKLSWASESEVNEIKELLK